ncbi:MAG: tripartite tricarboxylate transporter substrate-binding protein [Brotaphodocola sp.]
MKKRLVALGMAAAMVLSLTACGGSEKAAETTAAAANGAAAETEAPAKAGTETIKIICPYGVGGTADAIARKYALVGNKVNDKYNFIVENMTGGDGFAAATYYAEQPKDTKELLVYGYGVVCRYELGTKYQTEEVDFDRHEFHPIATVDDRTWILYTTPDQTLEGILAKAKESGVKMSGGNALSDPHLALGTLLSIEGGKCMVIPYDGGAAQMKALTDGEVDVFVGTTQAGQDAVEAGTLIPILAFGSEKFEGFVGPNGAIEVPGIVGDAKAPELDAAKDYSAACLRGGGTIATREGADQAWIDEMVEISKAVWADPEYSDWIASIMLNKYDKYDQDAVATVEEVAAKGVAAYELLSGQGQ